MNKNKIIFRFWLLAAYFLAGCATSQPVPVVAPELEPSIAPVPTKSAIVFAPVQLPSPLEQGDPLSVAGFYSYRPIVGLSNNLIEEQLRAVMGTEDGGFLISLVFQQVPISYNDLQDVMDGFLFSMVQEIPDLIAGEIERSVVAGRRGITTTLAGSLQGQPSFGQIMIVEVDLEEHSLFYALSFFRVMEPGERWSQEAEDAYNMVLESVEFLDGR